MSTPPLGRTVLVPVANPGSVLPLLHIAARLARADEGGVVLVTVLPPDSATDEDAEVWSSLPPLEDTATDLGVSVRTCTVRADEPAEGVLEAVADVDATLVLMGWRGKSSTSNVFGLMIDHVVGRSSVPLAVVRIGSEDVERVLLPISADHLLPGGDRGIRLAASLASRLAVGTRLPLTVLRTGSREIALPDELARLGDRVHHDPRRTDQAVGAMARAHDLVVAAVAPTVSGLRAATTHLAWAAPEATLLVAVDVGPRSEEGLAHAVGTAGLPAPRRHPHDPRAVRIIVTARLPEQDRRNPERLDRVLRTVGATDHLMAWWPAGDPIPHVRTTVTIVAPSVNAAIAAVMVAVDESPVFRGAEISYDVDNVPDGGGRTDDQSLIETTGVSWGSEVRPRRR